MFWQKQPRHSLQSFLKSNLLGFKTLQVFKKVFPLLSGLTNQVCALYNLQLKYSFCHLAPIDALTLQQGGTT